MNADPSREPSSLRDVLANRIRCLYRRSDGRWMNGDAFQSHEWEVIYASLTAPSPGLSREAIELAYGLLWMVGCDRSTPNGMALYEARKALLAQLDKDGQGRGITAARAVASPNTGRPEAALSAPASVEREDVISNIICGYFINCDCEDQPETSKCRRAAKEIVGPLTGAGKEEGK